MGAHGRRLGIAIFIGFIGIASSPVLAQSEAERLERLERVVEQLQKHNAELREEVRALKELRPAAAIPVKAAAKPESDSKQVAEKPATKEEKKAALATGAATEFKLTLSGFVQAQVEAGDVFAFESRFSRGPGEIDDRFRVRRGRLGVSGDYAEAFDFKVEGEFTLTDTALTVRDAEGRTLASNSTRTNFGATDIFVNWHSFPELNVKVGQYKAPFGLEQLTSDTKLFVTERSLMTTSLTPERQIGVQVWGKPLANLWPEQKDLITYYAGIFNGTGRNISVNDNNEFMYVGRIEVQTLKSEILNQEFGVKVGANGLSSRDETGTSISGLLRVNSDGSLSGYNLPSPGTREAFGLDFSLRFGPFDFIAEYLEEEISPRGSALLFSRFTANGYYLQGSYFLFPKKLQIATKWDHFNPGQAANDEIESITAGLNYYIKGDDIKLLANYIHTWSDFRENNPQFGQSEFDEVIVRLQVMF